MSLKWLTDKPIAHRGLHNDDGICPENSIKAFACAIESAYPIELDVQVTENGDVIVFHDSDLLRMCGIDRATKSLRKEELSSSFLKGGKESIPLLADVFKLVKGRVPILIEIKNLNGVKNAKNFILQILHNYDGPFALQSFDPLILNWFAKQAPQFFRGQLSSKFRNEKMSFLTKFLLSNFYLNFISKPSFIAFNVNDLPNHRVTSIRKKGMPVLGWTVKSESIQIKVAPHCDNIIFEGFKPKT